VDFKEASKLGSCLSKDYAEDLFRLLVNYESISASEAASRLNIHIKTTQDFLEDLCSLEIIVEGSFPSSVVHKIKIACLGGSSNVFKRALKASGVSMCASSIM